MTTTFHKQVCISGGTIITLDISCIDPWQLSPEDRQRVFTIIDTMKEWLTTAQPSEASQPEQKESPAEKWKREVEHT